MKQAETKLFPAQERIYEMGDIARRMVRCPDWLNLRAACVLAAAAAKTTCTLVVTKGGELADARNVVDLLALGVEPGETLEVLGEGTEAVKAVRHLTELINSGFHVTEGTPLAASLAAFSPGLPRDFVADSH